MIKHPHYTSILTMRSKSDHLHIIKNTYFELEKYTYDTYSLSISQYLGNYKMAAKTRTK